MKKSGGVSGPARGRSGGEGRSSRTEQGDMDVGTPEQSPGLCSYQTHVKEGGSSGSQGRVAQSEKGKASPDPGDLRWQTKSLG